MAKILIYSGTTEGRQLAEILGNSGCYCKVCVATEYGKQVMPKHSQVEVSTGRLDPEQMAELVKNGGFEVVVDATHPFAVVVSENIRKSLEGTNIPYLRLARNVKSSGEDCCCMFDSVDECIDNLKNTSGNILLTTGSKDLAHFAEYEEIRNRLFVRVLPGMESIELCYKAGLEGRQIIAMQGPFSLEMNEAIIKQYDINVLVTKESGRTGGADEKIQAALNSNIPVYMIKKPGDLEEVEELSMDQVIEKLNEITGLTIEGVAAQINVTLAGIGPGAKASMTLEVEEAISKADYIFGASRMIEGYRPKYEKYPYYQQKDILPQLENIMIKHKGERIDIVILFSGDTGFYSGSSNMYEALKAYPEIKVKVMPGISSVVSFAAKLGISWNDAAIMSTHGVGEGEWTQKLLRSVGENEKTFFLTSGVKDIQRIGELTEGRNVKIFFGYRLSYEDEQIMQLTPAQCRELTRDGLYVGLIVKLSETFEKEEASGVKTFITPGIADDEFIRDKVPMTKEEVREISICKLHLTGDATIYDIGSGTGSIAIEMACLSKDIRVFAIETNEEAVKLINDNKVKFAADNVEVVQAMAPDGMDELPAPTHAFIGGTKGNLKEILEILYKKNSSMRVVMNAVSLETISEMQEVIKTFPVENVDISQISVSKAKVLGNYNMMQANNPVYVFAFDFK